MKNYETEILPTESELNELQGLYGVTNSLDLESLGIQFN